MRITAFQHVPFETPAMIGDWAAARDHRLTSLPLYQGGPPDGEADLLVILGGPMGVGDQAAHPWLTAEKEAIRAAIDRGQPVLGICLGAQLIAAALGAAVTPMGMREIGWMPVTLADHRLWDAAPNPLTVLHWHGDRFAMPAGAVSLAGSAMCAEQAFLWQEHVLALQFHLEMDRDATAGILAHCADEIAEGGDHVHDAARILADSHHAATTRQVLFGLLDRWLGRLETP